MDVVVCLLDMLEVLDGVEVCQGILEQSGCTRGSDGVSGG